MEETEKSLFKQIRVQQQHLTSDWENMKENDSGLHEERVCVSVGQTNSMFFNMFTWKYFTIKIVGLKKQHSPFGCEELLWEQNALHTRRTFCYLWQLCLNPPCPLAQHSDSPVMNRERRNQKRIKMLGCNEQSSTLELK